MGMVTISVDDWLKTLAKKEPVELTPLDRKVIRDVFKLPQMQELMRQAVEAINSRTERLQTLNTLDQEQAAEALRIQGGRQSLIVIAEIFLEASNAVS